MRLKAIVIAVCCLIAVSQSAYAEKKKAVATILPLYVFAINVAGDRMGVDLLMQPGTDLHEFQLRPSDLKMFYNADIVIANGAGLDKYVVDRVQGVTSTADASAGIELIYYGEGVPDPHVWLDPVNAMAQVRNIKDAFSAIDPANKSFYEQNAGAYIKRLISLNKEIASMFKAVPQKRLITYHASFEYFVRRYDMTAYSLTGPEAEHPLPERIRESYRIIKTEDVKAVFAEVGYPEDYFQRMRDDLGVRICTLDPILNGVPTLDYYERAMRDMVNNIIRCFGG